MPQAATVTPLKGSIFPPIPEELRKAIADLEAVEAPVRELDAAIGAGWVEIRTLEKGLSALSEAEAEARKDELKQKRDAVKDSQLESCALEGGLLGLQEAERRARASVRNAEDHAHAELMSQRVAEARQARDLAKEVQNQRIAKRDALQPGVKAARDGMDGALRKYKYTECGVAEEKLRDKAAKAVLQWILFRRVVGTVRLGDGRWWITNLLPIAAVEDAQFRALNYEFLRFVQLSAGVDVSSRVEPPHNKPRRMDA